MTDYQKKFLTALNYVSHGEHDSFRTLFSPQHGEHTGFFLSYETPLRYQLVVANYVISKPFELNFDSDIAYLRFGIFEKGKALYHLAEKKREVTPSPFIVFENKASGKQVWQAGEHYKGIEIIIPMKRLKNSLMKTYPELKNLNNLERNFIYYNLPFEVNGVLNKLKHLALANTLTAFQLETEIHTCLCAIINALMAPGKNLFDTQYNMQMIEYSSNRTLHLSRNDLKAIEAAASLLKNNIASPPTINALCRQLFISEKKLTLGFKKMYHTSIGEYIIDHRLIIAAELLHTSDLTVSEIATRTGYANASNFTKAFKKKYLKTPLKFRKSNH